MYTGSAHAVASSPFARAVNPPATLLPWQPTRRERPTKGAALRLTRCAGHPFFTHLKSKSGPRSFPRICARRSTADLSRGEWHTSVPGSDIEKLQTCNLEEGLVSSMLFDTPLSCCILLHFFWYCRFTVDGPSSRQSQRR